MVSRKRARMSSAYSSLELPATIGESLYIDQHPQCTISTEFEKNKLIDDCLMNNLPSINNSSLKSDDLTSFLKLVHSQSDGKVFSSTFFYLKNN